MKCWEQRRQSDDESAGASAGGRHNLRVLREPSLRILIYTVQPDQIMSAYIIWR